MKKTYKIIDGHVHLYPEKLMNAILKWFENQGWEMPYKWNVDKHIEYLHQIGVEELMVLGYAHKQGISQNINEFLVDLANRYPEVKPYACIHQDDEDKVRLLKSFLDEKDFFGVKIHCYVQKVSAWDKRFEEVYKMLAERKKGLVLHASSMPVNTPYITPEHVGKLLEEYPDMKIMVAHLGLPEYHKEYLRLIDQYENLYLDTAYIFGNPRLGSFLGREIETADFLKETLKNYPDKIIYGSDFPIMDYPPEKAIENICKFNLGQVAEKKIFHDNARKFMGITEM